ncbi:lipoxygenase family protein [Acaryochloris marina NIES-2412]|uniref:lipoxygenase family protein n=1 Tax=Acaryochloris marina TaxID=155978 RepID=UPI0040582251
MTHQYSLTGLPTQLAPVEIQQEEHPQSLAPARPIQPEPIPTALKAARRKYQYNYSHLAPVAMVDRLPKEELPSGDWWSKLIRAMFKILTNAIVGAHNHHHEHEAEQHASRLIRKTLVNIFTQHPEVQWRLIWHLLKTAPMTLFNGLRLSFADSESFLHSLASNLEHDLLRILHLNLKEHLAHECAQDRPTSIEDFNQQFITIPLPECAQYFQEDEFFAYLRVAGPNPVLLQQVHHLSGDTVRSNFPVTNGHYQAVMGEDDSLQTAVTEGRLYIADYAILAGAINGNYPDQQKYISAPIALFAVPPSDAPSRNLHPIAIQCRQSPGPEAPILTPPTGEATKQQHAWEMAKTCVQIADSNYHEAVTHLGRTHLFISPFVIATHRQLLPSHPVSILLRPHFEGTLSINNGAQSMLMAPEGGVDTVLAATIDCARVLAVTGLQSYSFNQAMLPQQLQQQGLDNAKALPINPYRDDALLIWQAIETWVTDYLSLYYPTDDSVQKDAALQAWAKELQAEDGGRVPDFGEDGHLRTQAYLIQAITLIIFTASAQHAAVNFPQGDIMVYTPGMPLAGYRPAPTATALSSQDRLDQLPPLHQALNQMELTYLLGQIYHTQLGQYEKSWFSDERVQAPLHRFQANLLDIEDAIAERNRHRPYPYRYLQPSNIPQSINI